MVNMFDEIILNIILILFPIMVYLVFSCYKGLKNQGYSKILFIVTVFTSIYLCLKYTNTIDNYKLLLLLNIPIIVSYIKNEKNLAILTSILVIILCNENNVNLIFVSLKLLMYLIVYYYCKKYKKDNFIEYTAVIQGFFLTFEVFLYHDYSSFITLLDSFLIMLIFYFVTFIAVYLFKLADNVTNLYNDVKELEKEKQIKNSLFKLTHEIKNPLAVCKGYLDMIDIDNKEKANKYIRIIKQEIDCSLNIMTDFLATNNIKIAKEVFDINILLDDVYEGSKIILNNKNIKLDYINNNEEMLLSGDYARLKQVLLNLLKNSSEAIIDKGIITLSAYKKKKYYYIELVDNGKGMDNETLSKITEMFYTTKSRGNGIGVSLSNEIIKAHNGELIYESEINKGTKTIIKLPF